MPITVLATITPRPGRAAAVRAAFEQIIGDVHREEGCLLYALHVAGEPGAETLHVVEKWTSREALAAHAAGEPLERLAGLLGDDLVGPAEVLVADPVPAGDPAKGAL
ncbi:quinol monooxygenase YgiN [Kineococcus xinjiangensis]|uniref:Quinol monooxygenase YgiN n=1 Tax=Kineococcus xinjiangensis TaxID=512762 RepID=A0A2S6ITM1_9ACTN|nr:putative quinol monooxygenase [Kineococcus xinjiangensis]PPK97604.1 quinol monooxygenase YgiN [Kineococcus xinjiangensis]